MRKPSIVLADTFYSSFLESLDEGLGQLNGSFADSLATAFDSGFGTTGALSRAFSKIDWEVFPIVLNAKNIQNRWRVENGFNKSFIPGWSYGPHLARLEVGVPFTLALPQIHSTFYQQVKSVKPDVLFIQDLNLFSPMQIKALKRHCGLVVGEIASPLPPERFLKTYDLVFSALPPNVEKFLSLGIEAHYLPLGFDSGLIDKFPEVERDIDISFVGSVGKLWDTVKLLKTVVKYVPSLQIFGPISRQLLVDSDLLDNYCGEAWGDEMFRIFSRSKIALNRHGGIVKNFAGNMRMYEATGMGSLLLTEDNAFVSRLFTPEKEIVTYASYEDAGRSAASLLNDPKKLQAISQAGMSRTHTDHSYTKRAAFMSDLMIAKLESS